MECSSPVPLQHTHSICSYQIKHSHMTNHQMGRERWHRSSQLHSGYWDSISFNRFVCFRISCSTVMSTQILFLRVVSHTQTRSHTCSHSHTYMNLYTLAPGHLLTYLLTHSQTHSRTHTHIHKMTHRHTHTHTHMHVHIPAFTYEHSSGWVLPWATLFPWHWFPCTVL